MESAVQLEQPVPFVASSNSRILDNRRNTIQMSETPTPASVTVRLKRGAWEIEITTQEGKVQQAVESVLAGMASKEPMLVQAQEPEAAQRRFETCRGVLLTMWKEGWFASPRALSEVHEEMSRRGYHYDRTAVSHTLVDLVREGSLFRDGSMRNYTYVQKHPFKGQPGTS
ncbi:MAG: hypothetical protein JRN27_01605 [Nitrososphaerota archaeon]|nr:hypothetical protein [Nitrososphaerota archaeon]MDG6974779.1 hypothetical protein [Nitrososphaerota archaeon]MDG6981602.1 hypothetical protein [Nitrososphaerota archaeon]MDG7010042.1 hypothetical protein [Nitrososphaerota archaeon]MDG7016300.1 hypothetical protein [Nitrososphaerota archaeon]